MNLFFIILTCIIIYVLSLLRVRYFVRRCHSKGGRWSNISPLPSDFWLAVLPVINTLWAAFYLFDYTQRDRGGSIEERFFNIKK